MKLKEITAKIEEEFPTETAYEWDNAGLIFGDGESEIKKVMTTLDVTESVAEQAVNWGADLIISHHPLIFSPTKKINNESEIGRILLTAAKNGISIYAAHTNCDVGKNGINARLAEIFELEEVEPLEENGLGRIGNLARDMGLEEFAAYVKNKLATPYVRAGGGKGSISRVAIGSGACADSIVTARKKGADVMVTADMKYHEMLSAAACGIAVIDAGHYPTEVCAKKIFAEIISSCPVEVKEANTEDIFKYI